MAEDWQWEASDREQDANPQFRQFKKEGPAAVGGAGLWPILDGVAKQSARPESGPVLPTASRAADSSPQTLPRQEFATAPPPVVAATPATPSPAAVPPPAAVPRPTPPPPRSAAPPPASSSSASGFGHLFKRQSEEPAPTAAGTPLKALFKRIR